MFKCVGFKNLFHGICLNGKLIRMQYPNMDCSQFLNVVCQDLLVACKSENVAIKTGFYGYAA